MTLEQDSSAKGRLSIAIDGPAGAGKSTLAKGLAQQLGYLYVDTGAMYRALALKALRTGVEIGDAEALTAMAGRTSVRLERDPAGGNQVFLDGEDVSAAIREPDVERVVSKVSAVKGLRMYMVALQRQIAAGGGVVMDGRDIGSYVLPNADVKFFLSASLHERARRRMEQQAEAGHIIPVEQLEAEIAQRDAQDRNKGEHSLVQTPDAIYIDTTNRSVDEVLAEMLSHCRRG